MIYDPMGYVNLPPISPEQRQKEMDLIREQDEASKRSHQAWLRLCGSLLPIGGLSER